MTIWMQNHDKLPLKGLQKPMEEDPEYPFTQLFLAFDT